MYGIKRNQKINYFQLNITLKEVGFLLCKTPLFIFLYYCEWVMQNFLFFSFDLQTFFSSGDLVLIEDQLILISYERVRLKEEGPK